MRRKVFANVLLLASFMLFATPFVTRAITSLTEEEEKILKQLKKDPDDAEKFVGKELEDIEKEIK